MKDFNFGYLNNTVEPLIFNKWGDINPEDYVGKEVIVYYYVHGSRILRVLRSTCGTLTKFNGSYKLVSKLDSFRNCQYQ